jgi:hypothetical protein
MKIRSNINIFKKLKVQKVVFDLNKLLEDWLQLSILFEIKKNVKTICAICSDMIHKCEGPF